MSVSLTKHGKTEEIICTTSKMVYINKYSPNNKQIKSQTNNLRTIGMITSNEVVIKMMMEQPSW